MGSRESKQPQFCSHLDRDIRRAHCRLLRSVRCLTMFPIGLILLHFYRYGYKFLYETYLYHLVRQDNRHNFSVYFYHIYLSSARAAGDLSAAAPSFWEALQGRAHALLLFLPQALLLLVLSRFYYRSIVFCAFIQTFLFVTFNKVCTVQVGSISRSYLPFIFPFHPRSLTIPGAVFYLVLLLAASGAAFYAHATAA